MMRFALLAMTGLAAIAIPGCQDEEAKAPEPVRPVLSMIVEPHDSRQAVLVGSVEPRVSAQLAFRLLGRIVARNVDVGDPVKRGEPLASIDASQLQLQLQGARANLSSAQAQATNASGVEERQRILLESNNTPQATYDAARQALDSANASVEQAQAALAKAEEQVGYAQLYSDFDGIVTSVGAEVGQVVSAGQMVVTVARIDQRDAVIDIPDQFTRDLPLGSTFTVALQSAPNITAAGAVREIAPQSDDATRTRRVKLALTDAPASFRLGSTITARRDVAVQATIQVPQTAIAGQGDQTFVWVVEGDAVQKRPVKVAALASGAAVIAEGLQGGERVVTAGANTLKEGQKIKVDWQEPAQ